MLVGTIQGWKVGGGELLGTRPGESRWRRPEGRQVGAEVESAGTGRRGVSYRPPQALSTSRCELPPPPVIFFNPPPLPSHAISRPGMAAGHQVLQMIAIDVGVDLCRADVGMAQQFLHHTQVGAAGQQVRCK